MAHNHAITQSHSEREACGCTTTNFCMKIRQLAFCILVTFPVPSLSPLQDISMLYRLDACSLYDVALGYEQDFFCL